MAATPRWTINGELILALAAAAEGKGDTNEATRLLDKAITEEGK